jgi:hypothetical protein
MSDQPRYLGAIVVSNTYSTRTSATFMQCRAVSRPVFFAMRKTAVEKGAVMRTKSFLAMLIMTAVSMTFSLNEAGAGFPSPPGLPGLPNPPRFPGSPDVNVRINGYLPAPPGVNVRIDSGRPYYVERERRVYIEEERPVRYYKKRHYKKHHRHDDHDHGRGHGRGHDRGRGHGDRD